MADDHVGSPGQTDHGCFLCQLSKSTVKCIGIASLAHERQDAGIARFESDTDAESRPLVSLDVARVYQVDAGQRPDLVEASIQPGKPLEHLAPPRWFQTENGVGNEQLPTLQAEPPVDSQEFLFGTPGRPRPPTRLALDTLRAEAALKRAAATERKVELPAD